MLLDLQRELGELPDIVVRQHSAQGLVVRASPDGSRVYVGGDFTTVDGVARGHVAAFSTATGALLPWAPNIGGQVRALAVTPDLVYVGGNYPSANGQARTISELDGLGVQATPHMVTETLIRGMYRYWREVMA